MKIKMVILTKSSKYGQYCVAGINIDDGSWLRLVTDDEETHGAVSDFDLTCKNGAVADVLDVIEAPIIEWCNDDIQPENVLLDTDRYIKIVGQMTLAQVLQIHPLEDRKKILGNEYPYIKKERIDKVGYSLTIVRVSKLMFSREKNAKGKEKIKASFNYHGIEYTNMSVTDPDYYDESDGSKYKEAIIVVSIGAPYNDKYYKFVSAIYTQ